MILKLKKELFPFLLGAFCVPLSGSAQSGLSEEEVDSLKAIEEKIEGTYQVQMIGTRQRPAIPLSLYGKIESAREETEVVHYKVSDKMRIKILPEEKIEEPDFKGIEEQIVHISKKTEGK